MDHGAVARVARKQHGLVTRVQAFEAGATPRAIDRFLRSNMWESIREGVYVVGAAERSWHQRVLAACLAAGPDAYASHRTSARNLEVVDRAGRIELLTDGYRRVRLPGVLVHRTRHLLATDITVINGIPTTTLERTLVDLAGRQSAATLGRWIDRALVRSQLDLSLLARRTTELTMSGRPSTRSLMDALATRSPGHDPSRSVFEARIIAAMAERGLPELVRQHPIERPDGRRAFIDLSDPSTKVAVELDGWATHGVRSAFESDRIRGNDLLLLGWDLLRFTWMMTDDYICSTIAAAIAQRRDLSGRSATSAVVQ